MIIGIIKLKCVETRWEGEKQNLEENTSHFLHFILVCLSDMVLVFQGSSRL